MSEHPREIERVALAWLARLNEPEFDDWDVWEAWLAEDPEHAEAYWRLAVQEAGAVEALRSAPAVPSMAASVPARRARAARGRFAPNSRRWLPLAAAAAIVLVFGGLWAGWSARPQPWSVETAPGERRTVALADGSAVHLDGATRVSFDRRQPRRVVLEDGRVLVEVVHDDRRPFVLLAGDATLTDLGTAFDVTRLDEGLRVAVSEGVVRVDLQEEAVTLSAGQAIQATGGRIVRQAMTPEDMVAWRGGRLVYQQERLAVVAEDLTRATGVRVRAAPEIADRRFTGSLSAAGEPAALRSRLELVLGVGIVEDGEGWRLQSRPAA